MNARLRISVVMPVYNGAALIGRALSTVFAQDFQDLEILVVDDASTDDLASAVARFADLRLRLLRQDSNTGAAGARNRGIREARGELIAFLDSDDEWLPGKLARQLAQLETAAPECGLSLTGYELLRDRLGRREARPLPAERDWYFRLLAGCTVSLGSCALLRRSLFDEIGLFDESMRRLYDWDWLLRYAATRPIATIEEPLAVIHTGTSWPSVEAVERATRQIWERHEKTASTRSPAARRLLLSTLCYERAAALYHHQRPLKALWPALRSLLLYPSRGLGFYRHLLRRGGDALRWRFG